MSIQVLILMLFTVLIGNFITKSDGAFNQRDCLFTTDLQNDCESSQDCVNLHSKGPLNQYQHCVSYNNPENQKSKNVCCRKNYAALAKFATRAGTNTVASCPTFCPLIFKPVCGSDGVIYPSKCALQAAAACKDQNSALFEAHRGICSVPKVVDGEKIGNTKCRSNKMCNKNTYQPVCGSNGKTYTNICTLEKAACEDRAIKMVKKGKCGNSVIKCPAFCYKDYLPVCGSDGKTYKNACFLKTVTCKKPYVKQVKEGKCGGKSKAAEICSSEDCKKGYDPICGSNGKTYANPCIFKYATCKDISIKQVKKGRCVNSGLSILSSQNNYEGDILEDQKSAVKGPKTWPDKKVPYVIAPNSYDQTETKIILDAMKSIESKTCVRFVVRSTEKNYITISKANRGCLGYVGMQGIGNQMLSLDKQCVTLPIVKHQLMHVLGFAHEQGRSDRDEHLIIHWDNIKPGKNLEMNFRALDTVQTELRTPYDLRSIMHFEWNAGAKDSSKQTIIAKRGEIVDPSDDFTKIDIMDINKLYQCPVNSYTEWKEQAVENDKSFWAPDCDFTGTTVSKVKSRREECGTLCTTDLRCTHFTWESNGDCSLKTAPKSAETRPLKGALCGYVIKGNSNFEWHQGNDKQEDWANGCYFSGSDIRKVVKPKEGCFNLCNAEPKCTHYFVSYLPDAYDVCHMKNGKHPVLAEAIMGDAYCSIMAGRV